MKLSIAPMHNSVGKHDATGAFQPEARAFAKLHGAPAPFLFDHQQPSGPRVRQVQTFLASHEPHSVDAIAVFSHGYKSGLQIGVSVSGNLREFALTVAQVCIAEPVLALYCCDAARDSDDDREDDKLAGPGGDGGFADKLRYELGKLGCRPTIFAHASTGHTTHNPFVRRFDPGEMAGGDWVVEPHSELWLRWCRALRDTELRFRFPFMAGFELTRELTQGVGPAV